MRAVANSRPSAITGEYGTFEFSSHFIGWPMLNAPDSRRKLAKILSLVLVRISVLRK